MARRKRAKMNIPMVLAGVLLCLTLLSVHFSSGIYARYTTSADGNDSAKVASFGNLTLEETGSFSNASKTAIIVPGVDLIKNAAVSFSASEVSVYVIVEAELSNHWVTTDNETFVIENTDKTDGEDENLLSWSVADGWTYIEGSKFAYYKLLEPNEALENFPFVAENGKITVSKFITRKEISNLKDIKIIFKAYAVQAGDMTPEEAWNKVK